MNIALKVLLLVAAAASVRPGYLGFFYTIHSDGATQWLVVRGVASNSPAARASLEPLDVITAIDGKPIRYRDDLEFLDFLARIRPGQKIRLTVIHKQQRIVRTVVAGSMSDDAHERWQMNREIAARKRAAAAKKAPAGAVHR